MIGPWILSESERLTASLGTERSTGPKLGLDGFLIFVPLYAGLVIYSLFETYVAQSSRTAVWGLSFFLLYAIGIFVLHREYRPTFAQLGLHLQAFGSRNVRVCLLSGIAFVTIVRTFAPVTEYLLGLPVQLTPSHSVPPDVQQAWTHLPSFLVFTVLLHPAAEELIFRGYLYLVARQNWGEKTAALISSTLFALVHDWHASPWIFLESLLYIYLNNRGRSLLPSIITHIAYNASLLTVFA